MFFVLLFIFILLDVYAFMGVRNLISGLTGPLGLSIKIGYWVLSVLPLLFVVFGRPLMGQYPGLRQTISLVFSFYLGLVIAKLVFVIPHLLEDISRLVQGIAGVGRAEREGFMPGRRKFVSQMALGLAALPFGAFVYGILKGKYDYKVHRHTLHFPDLPGAFDGFTITQISDVHAGSFDNRDAVQRGLDLIEAQKSDMIVFTGDMVNSTADEFTPWVQAFGRLNAPFGKYSVFGNHDYGDYHRFETREAKDRNLQQLKEHHADAGFRLLLNEHVDIEKAGERITLVGVENWGRGFVQHGDLDKSLLGAPSDSLKVLLSHDPSHWEEHVKKHPTHIHLTLSGHTHGMQMGVEIPGFRWSPIKFRYPKWAGMYEEAGRFINVNRGFGFLGFSGRVGIWPEITVIELKRG